MPPLLYSKQPQFFCFISNHKHPKEAHRALLRVLFLFCRSRSTTIISKVIPTVFAYLTHTNEATLSQNIYWNCVEHHIKII